MNTPTPRTEQFLEDHADEITAWSATADFARQLERELADARLHMIRQDYQQANADLRAECERLKQEIRVDTPRMTALNHEIVVENEQLYAKLTAAEQEREAAKKEE